MGIGSASPPALVGIPLGRGRGGQGGGGPRGSLNGTEALGLVVRCRVLTTTILAREAGVSNSRAAEVLVGLERNGLVRHVAAPSSEPARQSVKYYYPTADGRSAIGRGPGPSPLALMPRVAHHVAAHATLFALRAALPASGGRLVSWRPGPTHWRARVNGHVVMCEVDGEATLALPEGVWRVALLYDGDPSAPVAALHDRLRRVRALRGSAECMQAGGPRVPPLLLLTAAAARPPAGGIDGVAWATLGEFGRNGPIDAGWHVLGARVRGARRLPEALALLGAPRDTSSPRAPVHVSASVPDLGVRVARLRPGDLDGRSDAPYLVALVYPPRVYALLHAAGQHPLMTGGQLAECCGMRAEHTHRLLARATSDGLLRAARPTGGGIGRARSGRDPGAPRTRPDRAQGYTLMRPGLAALARRAGLPLPAYRDICAILAEGGAGDPEVRRLRFARTFGEHTAAINATFLALRASLHRDGGRLESWRGEWACVTPFVAAGKRYLLFPDAAATLVAPSGRGLPVLLEVDRGAPASKLARKARLYVAYHASRGGVSPPLLFVTETPGRERIFLGQIAAETPAGLPPLDARACTLAALSAHGRGGASSGPVDRVWARATGPCDLLAARRAPAK